MPQRSISRKAVANGATPVDAHNVKIGVRLGLVAGLAACVGGFAASQYNRRALSIKVEHGTKQIAQDIEQKAQGTARLTLHLGGFVRALEPDANKRQKLRGYGDLHATAQNDPWLEAVGYSICPLAAGAGKDAARDTPRHSNSSCSSDFFERSGDATSARNVEIISKETDELAVGRGVSTGASILTRRTSLGRNDAGPTLLVVSPVYDTVAGLSSEDDRKTHFKGFAFSALSIAELVRSAAETRRADLELALYDRAQDAALPVYQTAAWNVLPDVDQSAISFQMLDKEWTLVAKPTADLREKESVLFPLAVAAASFLLTLGVGRILGIAREDRRRAKAYATAQRRLAAIVEGARDAILSIDAEGRIITWNESALHLLEGWQGGPDAELFYDLFTSAERANLVIRCARAFQGEESPPFMAEREVNGLPVCLWASLSPIPDEDGTIACLAIILRDVTAERMAEVEISRLNKRLAKQVEERTQQRDEAVRLRHEVEHAAHYDPLTDLPNRLLFRHTLEKEVAESRLSPRRALAIFMCDVDQFQSVNDTYGHQVGDFVLQMVGQRMTEVIAGRGMVARLGGDEYAVHLVGYEDRAEVQAIAESLIAAIQKPVLKDGLQLRVGLSIGIASEHLTKDLVPAEAIQRADVALYKAKEAGRNTVRFFDVAYAQEVAARSHLAADLHVAVSSDAFHLVYQPIVDAQTLQPLGFEALIRWMHPSGGEISPATFIPVAEDYGLIGRIGQWALAEACATAAAWPDAIRVAVNVSPLQLQQGGLEDAVVGALARSGLDPRRLEIEITESVLMDERDDVLGILHRLKGLGVAISLDDFGTGYSSLSYLRRFPFDKIKIDRSFIRDVTHPDAAAIVKAIVALGSHLKMEITAEGVEGMEQLQAVRAERCTQVQGYFVSKPLAASEVLPFIQRPRANAA